MQDEIRKLIEVYRRTKENYAVSVTLSSTSSKGINLSSEERKTTKMNGKRWVSSAWAVRSLVEGAELQKVTLRELRLAQSGGRTRVGERSRPGNHGTARRPCQPRSSLRLVKKICLLVESEIVKCTPQ